MRGSNCSWRRRRACRPATATRRHPRRRPRSSRARWRRRSGRPCSRRARCSRRRDAQRRDSLGPCRNADGAGARRSIETDHSMTTDATGRSLRSAIATIALLSASLLAFQVLLTRVCALRLHFHFGFLIISNSLLGIGASGSLLALVEKRWRRAPETWIRAFGLLYLLSLPLRCS